MDVSLHHHWRSPPQELRGLMFAEAVRRLALWPPSAWHAQGRGSASPDELRAHRTRIFHTN